jgi:hypothetical protein
MLELGSARVPLHCCLMLELGLVLARLRQICGPAFLWQKGRNCSCDLRSNDERMYGL